MDSIFLFVQYERQNRALNLYIYIYIHTRITPVLFYLDHISAFLATVLLHKLRESLIATIRCIVLSVLSFSERR